MVTDQEIVNVLDEYPDPQSVDPHAIAEHFCDKEVAADEYEGCSSELELAFAEYERRVRNIQRQWHRFDTDEKDRISSDPLTASMQHDGRTRDEQVVAEIRETIRRLAMVENSVANLPGVPGGRKSDLIHELNEVRDGLRQIAQAAGVEY